MKKYANDFRRGEKGYEYAGNWYELTVTGEELKRRCLSYGLCLAAVSVLLPLGLTRNNGGSHISFILLPYVGAFLPLVYGWMAVCGLFSLAGKERKDDHLRLRRMDYERCIRRPWQCALALTVLSGVSLAANLIWLALQGGEVQVADEMFFLVILLGIFVLSLLSAIQAGRLYRKVTEASSPKQENFPWKTKNG